MRRRVEENFTPCPVCKSCRRKVCLTAVLALLGALLASGCGGRHLLKAPEGKTVLLISFESPADTSGWYWAGDYRLSTDTPPGGGKRSLLIAGNPLMPAASFITRPLRRGGHFVIECWGKTRDIGGYLQLSSIEDHEIGNSIRAPILQEQWQHSWSADTLFCRPGQSLLLSIQAGGMAGGSLSLDMIRIRKLAPPQSRKKHPPQVASRR